MPFARRGEPLRSVRRPLSQVLSQALLNIEHVRRCRLGIRLPRNLLVRRRPILRTAARWKDGLPKAGSLPDQFRWEFPCLPPNCRRRPQRFYRENRVQSVPLRGLRGGLCRKILKAPHFRLRTMPPFSRNSSAHWQSQARPMIAARPNDSRPTLTRLAANVRQATGYFSWLKSLPRWRALSSSQASSSLGGEMRATGSLCTSLMALVGQVDMQSPQPMHLSFRTS